MPLPEEFLETRPDLDIIRVYEHRIEMLQKAWDETPKAYVVFNYSFWNDPDTVREWSWTASTSKRSRHGCYLDSLAKLGHSPNSIENGPPEQVVGMGGTWIGRVFESTPWNNTPVVKFVWSGPAEVEAYLGEPAAPAEVPPAYDVAKLEARAAALKAVGMPKGPFRELILNEFPELPEGDVERLWSNS